MKKGAKGESPKTFETWFFEYATPAERQLSAEDQEHAYEMWLTQEIAWTETIDDFEGFDDFGNPIDFPKIH